MSKPRAAVIAVPLFDITVNNITLSLIVSMWLSINTEHDPMIIMIVLCVNNSVLIIPFTRDNRASDSVVFRRHFVCTINLFTYLLTYIVVAH